MYDFINDLITKQESRVVPKSKYRTTKSSFRQSLIELANSQNESVPAERRVSQHAVLSVAERSLSSTSNLEKDTRRFIAYKEAASFVSFAATGDVTNTSLEKYYDLLPVGHPASTRKHAMTASAFRHTRARWVAADPRLDESVREIVAAAYMYESNTVEHSHAITRLAALTAASVPRDIFLSALTAAFSFGDGNSSAARSMRANLQWRDRLGRWIEMGRGIGFKININGNNVPINGKFIGVDGKRGLVQVKNDPNLPDGIYPVESSNAQEYKALLPDSVAGKLTGKLSSILDKRAQIPSQEEMVKMRMDAPAGWKKNEDGSFSSDDDYVVEESDGKLTLFRKDKNGDKGSQVGEQVDDWAQIQDLANADQKDYDKFKRIMSAPQNADVLPGSETDPYDKLPETTKDFLKKQEEKEAADEAFFKEKKKKHNEDVDKFERMFEQGKDIEGRDIPEGWELAIVKYQNGAPEIRSFQKLVPSLSGENQVQIIAEVRDDGKIHFGHRASWFNKDEQGFEGYDTWEEAEAQIPRVLNWVKDHPSLIHDPANPWYKETIPVPRGGDEPVANLPETPPAKREMLYGENDVAFWEESGKVAKQIQDAIDRHMNEKATTEDRAIGISEVQDKVKDAIEYLKKKDKKNAISYLTDAYDIASGDESPSEGIFPSGENGGEAAQLLDELITSLEEYNGGDGGGTTPPSETPPKETPGGGFADYVIDLSEDNRDLGKDLEERLEEDASEVGDDLMDQIYEDASERYELAQDIADNKPDDMSREEFVKDAVARMREQLSAIVDSAIQERRSLEDDENLEIDFDKEAFVNAGAEKFEELLNIEFDNMDDGGDDGDGGGIEPTAPEPTAPEAPAAETPAVKEESAEVLSKLEAPKGAWKLQSPDKFEPEGRVDDEMSPDFSDDPEVLANKFSEEALVDAFIQAVIGKKDYALDLLEEDDVEYDDNGEPIEKKKGPGAPKKKVEKGIQGFGNGALDFSQGEEWVPAEALYLALKNQGYDVDLLLAQLYDSGLGESKNQDLLKSLRKEENVQAETPLVDAIDLEDAEVMERVNAEVAAPGPAGAVMAQLEEINKNGEPNQKIVELAARVRQESKNPSGSALSEDLPEAFVKMLEDYIGFANSSDPDEKQAFQALWGAIIALDGGLSDGKEETSVQRAVSDALEKYNGTQPSYEEVQQFFLDNGKFTDLMRSKKALVDGNESLDDSESFAAAYYRLIAEASRYNDVSLHRGLQVPVDSDFIKNLKKGNAVAFDARPFSRDRNTAAMFAGAISKGNLDKAAVIFKIAPLKGKSVDMASISPFPDEQEQVVAGNFKIVGVKKSKNSSGKEIYEVEVERITKRDAVLDGYDSSYEDLLMAENISPEMPEGYHQIDPAKYQSAEGEGFPGGFEDKPDVVARNYERDTLVEVFRNAIEDGTGEVTLGWDDAEISVPVELIRDALQIQGLDTNSLLNDIANAEPGVEPSDEADSEPAEQNLDNPVDEIIADVSTEYDMEGWKKVGPQLGSNEGGFYEDAEGNRFYVKKPKSELHAENEVLAAALYKLLGINAAEIGIGSGDDGVKMTFSPDIIGSKQDLQKKLDDPEYLAKLQEGFAVDAWLGNWDVAGLAFDNVMSDGDGNPVRVDPGGALLFRAMGKPKGTLFGNEVNELDTLRDPNMNPQSAAIFGSMTDEQQKESARKLLDISNDDIGSMVDGIITDEKAAEELKTKLKARRQFILDKYDLLSEDTSVVVDNADISEEQDADPEAVMTPEGIKSEVDAALDTAGGWAQEYADDEDLLPSQRKNFQKVADQIDTALVDWRNGEISNEELSNVLQELMDFNESFNWNTKDPEIMNKVDDISEQLQALKDVVDSYNKPAASEPEATPEEQAPVSAPEPVMKESVNNPVIDSNGTPINPGAKVRYEKKGVVLEGTFSRYDKSPQYVWVNFGDGKKPKAISTKYLTVIEGGGGGGPKAPEAPESPEPTGTETPNIEPQAETPQEDIGQFEPTAQLTKDGKVRVSFVVDGNRPFNPNSDTGPNDYSEVLPYVVDEKLDVDGVDEVTIEVPLDKMDEFAKTYKSVFDEKIVPEEFYGDIYTDYQEPKPEDSAKVTPEPEVKTKEELPEFSREGWTKSVAPDEEILGVKKDNSNRIIFDKKQENGSSLRITVDKDTLEDPKLREGLEDFFTSMDDLHKRYPIDGLVVGINKADPENPEVLGTTASYPGEPPVIMINREVLTKKQRLSVEHVAAHEYGHALDPRSAEEAEKGLEDFKALMTPTFNKFPMTEYGLTSGREAFAEAFAAFYVRKYGKPFDANAPKTSYTQSQKVFQNDKFWENTIKHFNIEELATQFERAPFKVEDTFDEDNPATLQEDYTPEAEAPEAVKPSPSTPFPDEPILNEAADELVKLFSYGMPEGGEILAVNEKGGMIAATPDGDTVYIIDAKKKTNYTPEAKVDFFKPGGNGIEVFQWRQLSKEENDALLEKISQNKSEPYGTESEAIDDVDATGELEVPDGFMAIDDSKGKKIFAGVKVADKDGVIGTVKKVNKDNYALVDFGDGVVKWRSGKTLNSTGEVDENFQGPAAKSAPKTKTTGAGAAPVIVDSPADWKLSNFEGVPALPDAIAKALDTDVTKAAMRGASAAVDADSIEDLDVRVMHVRDENGVDNIQLKFKLTNWAGKKRIAEIAKMTESERVENGIQVEPLRIQRINVGPDGVGQISSTENAFTNNNGRTYTITTNDGIVIRIHRANADAGDQFTKSYGETPARAFHNTVQIQAPVDATEDQIANALALAGVSEVRPATPADAQILVENRLMSIFDAQTDANTNLKGEKRAESLENVKNKWGLTVDDVIVTTGASGRIEYRLSEEGARKIWEATGKPEALSHGLRNPGVLSYTMSDDEKVKAMVDWVVGFVDNPQGGLLSTTTRWTEGVGGHGQSSTADIGTGGADYVFTRPTKSADRKKYGTTDWIPTLYFDPLRAYQRLDFYANYTDAFGKRSKNKDVISAAKVGAYEVMFKHRLSWDELDVMVVSKEMHPGIIEGLKARGIDTIGGRPIEEVIITGGTK